MVSDGSIVSSIVTQFIFGFYFLFNEHDSL